MTKEEIREICIDGSQAYYDHLDRNNKGVHVIRIRSIEKVKEDKLKLKITSKIFDQETLIFKCLATNEEWTIESVKIQVYDRDTNTIVIKPNSSVFHKMVNASVNDWQIISDLKFLIQRVKEWYELNGKDLKLPDKASVLNTPKSDIYFEESVPSEEQINALKLIFNEPLSYIWGAPGTGKTQFVLSYAILHYLENNKKVTIVAPTNHALEQIYRGVIKMTDKAGIKRENILRLGGPSKKFADDYPEVCEIIGLENQLKQLNDQIVIIENILGIDGIGKKIENINLLKTYFKEIEDNYEQASSLYEKEKSLLEQKKLGASEARSLELKIQYNNEEQLRIKKKKTSLTYKFISVFSKVDLDAKINSLIDKQVELENLIVVGLNKRRTVDQKISSNTQSKQESLKLLKIAVQKANVLSESIDIDLPEITLESNFVFLTEQLDEEIQILENNQPVYEALSMEYKTLDKLSLEAKYQKLKADKEHLENYSTEQRLKNVSIVGATLDTYLYRFREEKLNTNHVFLDEAGYSNIIKAMTLFNQDIPVTFLGDHMQLPPVCEISKRDIQNDENFRPVMVWDQSAIYLEDLFAQDQLNTVVSNYLNGERAPFQNLKKTNLTGTFRFGKSLADVLQQYVYPEGFHSKLNTETEIIIYNVKNAANNRGRGRLNLAEANAIVNLVKNNFSPEASVAVLAPYSAQVRAISNELPAYQQNNKVLTVHKSQGQEWDTVIYSVCDIGNGRKPWFTDSQNAMSSGLNNINTAISRAKERLIMVCDEDEWVHYNGQLITGILQAATKRVLV
ncbi:AAA domain-containing protein [Croceitalea sp. P059]|uniref:DEAD/DEAH box helicase n=1 Tax=Croceitalea sp. P059 TaxID=3075601 RepID=UPI0028841855|nr:AAA domain-containing protein [Croceitalea sp. P059]MDT0538867.1 AAA domain-containing protein [Croceitalea sp. P059]